MLGNDLEYWFMRWLVDSDQFSRYGSNHPDKVIKIGEEIGDGDDAFIKTGLDETLSYIRREMLKVHREQSNRRQATESLIDEIIEVIDNREDLDSLGFAMRAVGRTTLAINEMPESDREYAEEKTKEYLNEHGEDGLPGVLKYWDQLGKRGSISAERGVVIPEVKRILDSSGPRRVSAFLQEFERRVGNLRPHRAGGSLEDVTETVLNYFNVENTGDPEELTPTFEVDNRIPLHNSNYIGISCKRTLRERFKESTGIDSSTMDEHDIKEVWHLVTFQSDISSEKAEAMVEGRERLYLRDCSKEYEEHSDNEFVRPLSELVSDIREIGQ